MVPHNQLMMSFFLVMPTLIGGLVFGFIFGPLTLVACDGLLMINGSMVTLELFL